MNYLPLFKMPKPMKITGRSSSITNSFINSIIPVIQPTNEQVKKALEILGMNYDSIQCSYCGAVASEWDHLRPLVKDKMPTGYVSEIHNLVPACGKCNQSKGNKPWADWMVSSATLSPKSRRVEDIEQRMERLREYEQWEEPTRVDFEQVVGSDLWKQHWENCEQVQSTMRHAQKTADMIKKKVVEYSDNQGIILLICPPVTPYSSVEEIEAWIKELGSYPDQLETREALKDAEAMLKERTANSLQED